MKAILDFIFCLLGAILFLAGIAFLFNHLYVIGAIAAVGGFVMLLIFISADKAEPEA